MAIPRLLAPAVPDDCLNRIEKAIRALWRMETRGASELWRAKVQLVRGNVELVAHVGSERIGNCGLIIFVQHGVPFCCGCPPILSYQWRLEEARGLCSGLQQATTSCKSKSRCEGEIAAAPGLGRDWVRDVLSRFGGRRQLLGASS